MVYFDRERMYIDSQDSLLAKIQAIEAIIDALLVQMATIVTTAGTDEYMLNDGQTIIKTKYRDPNQVEAAINGMRRLKNIYLKEYNQTGVVRAMDNKNFFPRIY